MLYNRGQFIINKDQRFYKVGTRLIIVISLLFFLQSCVGIRYNRAIRYNRENRDGRTIKLINYEDGTQIGYYDSLYTDSLMIRKP